MHDEQVVNREQSGGPKQVFGRGNVDHPLGGITSSSTQPAAGLVTADGDSQTQMGVSAQLVQLE